MPMSPRLYRVDTAMNTILQTIAVSMMSVRSLPQRLIPSLVIVIGMGGAAAVLVAMLSLSRGLSHTISSTGSADRAIVLRAGADAEEASILPRDALAKIVGAPGVARMPSGQPIVSTEILTTLNIPGADGRVAGSVTLRGVSADTSTSLRPEIHLVEGRTFRPGFHELVVGGAAQGRFGSLGIGHPVKVLNAQWTVVGTFEGGGTHDAELLGDAETLMGAYRRTSFSAVTVKLTSPVAFRDFRRALMSDPAISVAVGPEWYYYEAHSQIFAKLLTLVATVIGGIMAVGAVFAAMNTMYSAVVARTIEIATLRAIGFGASAVIGSVLIEALLLALLGSFVGGAVVWLLLNGSVMSTVSGAGINNVIVRLHVGGGPVMAGMAWACVVGLLGGLLPGLRAARLPVETALRPA
jgi:putative ABC transport system permease protein